MSVDFIRKKQNSDSLDVATRQQKQLSYLTTSEIQEDIRVGYFEEYVDRKYYNEDVFLNWVKQVLKVDNFLSFAKYFRNPNPSSALINSRIKEPLSRVFFSEDSYFKYVINGQDVEDPEELKDNFDNRLFNAVLFHHNDIIVHDLEKLNTPYREFICIDKVVSIDVKNEEIRKLAYTGKIERDGEEIYGYVYLDTEKYEFYTKDFNLLISEPHDYGKCPATFVVSKMFDRDEVIKESIFTHVRASLEEYNFLVTLQRMSNANGVLPITVTPDIDQESEGSLDFDAGTNEPMGANQIGSQVSEEARGNAGAGGGSIMQAGTNASVPVPMKNDGSMDMELLKNFITFYYLPVEASTFLDKRINELEQKIIINLIGDYSEGNEASMTEMQVSKGYVSKEDKLRWVSNTMSYSRGLSDNMFLGLKYGSQNVKTDIFFGSDFFLQTQGVLYDMFAKAPNAIERKNILVRVAQRRNMYNKEKSKKEVILYKLMPYTSDKDFDYANDKGIVDPVNFEYQTRFSYWVGMFESE